MTPQKNTRITGVGAALVDLLIHEEDAFLSKLGKEKGGMTLVNNQDIQDILIKTSQKPQVVPGGATCNTLVGVGHLGGECRFIGKRGDDHTGLTYEEQLNSAGVETTFDLSRTSPTGKVLSVITPDAQRSMFTYLGASTELAPAAVSAGDFKETAIAVIEGYLLFNRDLMKACLESAKAAGARIALDLASFEVVRASRDILEEWIKEYVDILIANEDEAEAYTGISNEIEALEKLSQHVSIAVLKVGARGSYVVHEGKTVRISPLAGCDVKDTTGAGDLWAAGFLYGIAHGYSLEKSGEIASACGFEVCQVIGAHIPENGWERIRAIL